MRTRLLVCLLLAALAAAPAVFAADSVLTGGGALYAIGKGENENTVYLFRRAGEEKSVIAVPATADDARECNVELEYDRATDTVYVAWVRGTSEIQVATLNAAGEWSKPLVITTRDSAVTIGELRLSMTHAKAEDHTATLLHASWWEKAAGYAAKYALVAMEKGEHLSTVVSDLNELADISSVVTQSTGVHGVEGMGAALFPPLAMAPEGEGVDVVYGSDRSTALTRLILKPKAQARLWRPGKSGGSSVPPSRLVSASSAAIQAYLGRERLILYTREGDFHFVVFMNGEWSPVRTIALDANLTREQALTGLRRLGGE